MKELRINILVKSILVFWFIVGIYLQHNIGLADTGDFTRVMRVFTSGPVGIEPNWPPSGTEDWAKRFFNYWIPFWKLEWQLTRPTTSAIILWLPGVLLNYFLYSNKILYLTSISFFPKLVLFLLIIILFNWIDHQTKCKPILLVSLGLPIILMFTATDYVAYLNSFYQETASFIFLFLTLASILYLIQKPSFVRLLFCLISIFLLSTAKQSNIYWPCVAIPFALFVWYLKKKPALYKLLITGIILIPVLTVLSSKLAIPDYPQVNRYDSLFYGVLTFSENPSMRLKQIGINDEAIQCIGESVYLPVGNECLQKYQGILGLRKTLQVIYHEPGIILRQISHVLNNMQAVSLDYLGKYSINDPRSQISWISATDQLKREEQRIFNPPSNTTLLNSWVILKYNYFPTGYSLGIALIIFVGWFTFGVTRKGIYQDLSIVGLLATITCVIDMGIAILGAGRYELVKHLFLSNVLFDIAAIVFITSVLIFSLEVFGNISKKILVVSLSNADSTG